MTYKDLTKYILIYVILIRKFIIKLYFFWAYLLDPVFEKKKSHTKHSSKKSRHSHSPPWSSSFLVHRPRLMDFTKAWQMNFPYEVAGGSWGNSLGHIPRVWRDQVSSWSDPVAAGYIVFIYEGCWGWYCWYLRIRTPSYVGIGTDVRTSVPLLEQKNRPRFFSVFSSISCLRPAPSMKTKTPQGGDRFFCKGTFWPPGLEQV